MTDGRVGLVRSAVCGALAGVAGGMVFGAAMAHGGALPTIASIVRARSPVVGFVVHMVIAAVIGAGFGVLVARHQAGADGVLYWGVVYGTFWWFCGPLTLLPLFAGRPVTWTTVAARAEVASLLGHLVYGATTALTFALLSARLATSGDRRRPHRLSVAAFFRGMCAGVFLGWLLGLALDAQGSFTTLRAVLPGGTPAAAWIGVLVIGATAGLAQAALCPEPTEPAGVTLARGVAFGFLWWALVAVTLLPLIEGTGLAWSLEEVRGAFATFPGYVLFLGAGTSLGHSWLTKAQRSLFSDVRRDAWLEGAGTRGLQAIGWGSLAGLIGGLFFTIVMVGIDFLPTVASLLGSSSRVTGFIVHLAIADVIGVSYGLAFRRTSYDATSALGWGVTYGVLWWLLGPLTLLPLLLGSPPTWSAAAAVAAFPALVGHLVYGAALGLVFYRIEVLHNPWWVTRSAAEAARTAQRREQMLGAAPALWALAAVVALTLPLILVG